MLHVGDLEGSDDGIEMDEDPLLPSASVNLPTIEIRRLSIQYSTSCIISSVLGMAYIIVAIAWVVWAVWAVYA